MAKRTRTALREEARRKGARLDERRSVRSHRGGRRPGLVKKLRRKRVGFVEGSEVSPHRPRQRAQSRCSTGTKLPIERRKTRNLLMSGQQAEGETSATALVQPDNCCATNLASGHSQVKRSRTILWSLSFACSPKRPLWGDFARFGNPIHPISLRSNTASVCRVSRTLRSSRSP